MPHSGEAGPLRHALDAAAKELIDAEADNAPAATVPPTGARALFLAASLILIAFNLRIAVTSLGPVLRDAVAATALSVPLASLLTTVPSLCFGLLGPTAPALGRRLGTEGAVLAALIVLTAGCGLRGLPNALALFGGQVLACGAIGIVNVLLPGLIKRDFPAQVAALTGLYTMAFCAGAAMAAGITVPIAAALGGSWSAGLAFWAIPAAMAVAAWATQVPRRHATGIARTLAVRGLWRDPLAWQLTLFMGLQSALAYIVFGWLVPILRDRGLDPVEAGLVLSVSVLAQAAASLIAPYLGTLGKDQRAANAIAVALCLAGLLGCMYGPLWAIWASTIILGLAQGSLIALALTQIALRAPDARVAAQLSSMCQGIGYLLASAGPLVAGLLHGWTGGWNSVAVFCVAIGGVLLPSGIGCGRARHVRARG